MGAAVEVLDAAGLTVREAKRLAGLEEKIDKGLGAFVEVGKALAEISEKKLYRATHGTFADYCEERWGIGRDYAYKKMKAASVIEVLSTSVDRPVPRNEATARPLAALLDKPEALHQAWNEAVGLAAAEDREPSSEDVIGSAVWKASRQAKLSERLPRLRPKPVGTTQRARIAEVMMVIVELPSLIAKIELAEASKSVPKREVDEHVASLQAADQAVIELQAAIEGDGNE